MEKTNISFNKIEILDWYDGIIRAIGEVEDEFYLIVLVAWDMKQPVKLYVVLELNELTKSEIIDELNGSRSKEENWEIFNSIFNRYVQNYNGVAYVILGEVKKNESYRIKTIDSSHIKKLANYEFEDTMSENNKNFWLKI
ncbi:MAG TPA: hypothetical protein VF596_17945 [Pyrinomonadaceae bacterium]|jgi:hypothetical protein